MRPGVDEPLIARYENYAGQWLRELYFVTDGQGRQLSVGDEKGAIDEDDFSPGGGGWRYSGAAQNASGFGAERLGPGDMPGVSMFRNRAYDSRTGRWTQEDPIGVAGGLNLYQFNGNDPVAFSDPFGTCKIDVRFSEVAGGLASHAYIVTTDPDNTRTYFRGGPSEGGRSGGMSSASGGSSSDASGSDSDSGNSSSPGSGDEDGDSGPWGALSTASGNYEPGTVDYEEGSPPTMTVLDNDEPCDEYNASFSSTLQQINVNGTPYNPFTTNSNAVVGTALRRAGLPLTPRPVWAPGFNRNLLP